MTVIYHTPQRQHTDTKRSGFPHDHDSAALATERRCHATQQERHLSFPGGQRGCRTSEAPTTAPLPPTLRHVRHLRNTFETSSLFPAPLRSRNQLLTTVTPTGKISVHLHPGCNARALPLSSCLARRLPPSPLIAVDLHRKTVLYRVVGLGHSRDTRPITGPRPLETVKLWLVTLGVYRMKALAQHLKEELPHQALGNTSLVLQVVHATQGCRQPCRLRSEPITRSGFRRQR